MKCTRIAWTLSLALALAACDGGSRGSGITTAQGNVESVATALRAPSPARRLGRWARAARWLKLEGRAEADAGVAGIRVLVEGTPFEDVTDGSGAFAVRGDFQGDVVIRFEEPASGAAARITVNAPAGGVLTFDRVHLDEVNGQATAQSVAVAFDGVAVTIDCPASRLWLASRHRTETDTDIYEIHLEGSSIRDANGSSLTCQELRAGDLVRMRGAVNDDGTFGQAEIVRGG